MSEQGLGLLPATESACWCSWPWGKVPVGSRGSSQQLLSLLVRDGLQRPNSTQQFAALHQTSKRGDAVYMLVGQSAEARTAAQAAVAAGHVSVGSFQVPISWTPSTLPPGCTEVTVHQLPIEWVRQGCGTALLQAAQTSKGRWYVSSLGAVAGWGMHSCHALQLTRWSCG